ncbi:MAG: divalent-cation tolerance protein CutA [Desulfurococcales archaeon]|nr:divalent-cation tolerance protein CutA [Desulfurococcales archaeon]
MSGERVVLITAPKGEGARIARFIVERRLAACVNVVPGVKSFYWWEGRLVEDSEELLVVKTVGDLVERLVAEVKRVHPYTVPEIISLPVEGGNADYLKWVREEVSAPSGPG